MEFGGDEKRIQALFSELSREDQSRTPRFEKLWLRAQTNTRVPALISIRSVTVFAAVVVFAAVCLVATSSWYGSAAVNVLPLDIPIASVPRVMKPEQLLSSNSKTLRSDRQRRPVRRKQTERATTREVVTLSTWQSPTTVFLQSPTATALTTLPQLDQSARELENFLPKNNELIKESNQ